MKLIRFLLAIMVGISFFVSKVVKPVTSIENPGSFDRVVRGDMVIAHFYYKNKDIVDPDYNYTTDLFKALEDRYDGLVHCIKINIERTHLAPLGREYHIKKTPTFVLFAYGKEKDRMVSKYPGKLALKNLSDFIEKNFKKELKEKIKRLEEERKRRQEERRRSARYWRYYYGPYDWYYHPGYHGWGWRWGGYYGSYYGPYHHGYGRFGGRYGRYYCD